MLQIVETKTAISGEEARGYSDEENQAMQRAVVNLFDKWQLTNEDASVLLGGISPKTFMRWKKGEYGRLSIDQSDRLSNLLAIHKALRLIFDQAEQAYAWVRKSSTDFGEQSALEIMLGGHLADIERIRRYLDHVRGGW